MSTSLTDAKVLDAKLPPGKKEHYILVRNGLYLRLRAGQGDVSKTWVYRYLQHGAARKMVLGDATVMSVDDALRAALDAAQQLRQGTDPLALRQLVQAQIQADAVAARLGGTPQTVSDLIEQWLVNYAQHHHSDGGQRARAQAANHVLPHLGQLHLALLRPPHITGLLNNIRSQGKSRTCGAVLSIIRQSVQWAVVHEYLPRDVTLGIKSSHWGGNGEIRTRVLSMPEIQQLYHQLTYATLPQRWRHAIWLMLACGTRVEETLLAERTHVNLEQRTWTLPGENRKWVHGARNKAFTIQLSDFALEQMRALLQIGGDRFLFAQVRVPGKPERPVSSKTLSHLIADRQTDAPKPGRTQYVAELQLPGGAWTPHDLRRTCATQMGELGVRPDVIDKCLAHSIGGRITQTYQHQTLRDEMRAAWDAWGARLAELVQAAAADTATAKACLADLEARQAAKLASLRVKAQARAKARAKADQAGTKPGTPAKTKTKVKAKTVADQAAGHGRHRAAQVQA